MFAIIQEERIIIGANNILISNFPTNLKDDKSREDKKNGGSIKTLETNIKIVLKNKRKNKYKK